MPVFHDFLLSCRYGVSWQRCHANEQSYRTDTKVTAPHQLPSRLPILGDGRTHTKIVAHAQLSSTLFEQGEMLKIMEIVGSHGLAAVPSGLSHFAKQRRTHTKPFFLYTHRTYTKTDRTNTTPSSFHPCGAPYRHDIVAVLTRHSPHTCCSASVLTRKNCRGDTTLSRTDTKISPYSDASAFRLFSKGSDFFSAFFARMYVCVSNLNISTYYYYQSILRFSPYQHERAVHYGY